MFVVLTAHGTRAPGDQPLLLSQAPDGRQRHVFERPVSIRARVLSRPRVHEHGWHTTVRLQQVWIRADLPLEASDRVEMYGGGPPPDWRQGAHLQAWVTLSKPSILRNLPPEHPISRRPPPEHLFARLKSTLLVDWLEPPRHGPGRWLAGLRERAEDNLRAAMMQIGASPHHSSLALALSLGQRQGVQRQLRDNLRRSGVAHILALSGLHLTALTTLLGGLLHYGIPRRRLAHAALLLALLVYILMLPPQASILRAGMMAAIPLLAGMAARRSDALNLLGAAGLILLGVVPAWASAAGFQLSFVVTAALLHGAGQGDRQTPRTRLWPMLRTSITATAAALPLTAWHFGAVAPAAIAVNLVAVPLASLMVVVSLLALVLALISADMALPMAYLLHGAAAMLDRVAQLGATLPGGYWPVPRGRTALTVLALAAVFVPQTWPRLRWPALLITQSALLLPWPAPVPLPHGQLSLRILDVGQGDSLLVRLPGGDHMLVDGGGWVGSRADIGEKVIVPALMDAGVRQLRVVVLSHAHEDHGGGLSAVLRHFHVGELWLPELASASHMVKQLVDQAVEQGTAVRSPRAGEVRRFSQAQVSILWPPPGPLPVAINNQSLVLRLDAGNAGALLTGDIEHEAETEAIRMLPKPTGLILKVAHHGSRTSTTEPFLNAIRPGLGLISAGRRNRWQHPHPEVLDRLRLRGVPFCRTDIHGAVTVTALHDRIRVESFGAPCRLTARPRSP